MTTDSLTGDVDTARLPVLAPEPVTVTVSRTPRPGCEAEFEAWIERSVAGVSEYPGCLGGGAMRPAEPGGEWHLVFRFVDGLALRRWERSPEREALLADIDRIGVDMKVQRTVGVDDWFDLPTRAVPHKPFLQRVAGDVLWVYPVALLMAVFVSPLLAKLSLGVRVLVSGIAIALVSQTVLRPLRTWIRTRRHFG